MKPGDLVLKRDNKFGHHRLWEIEGVYLGAEGQESVVALRSLSHRPAHSGTDTTHETIFVPEMLIRGCIFGRAVEA